MIRPARADDYAVLQEIERRAGELFREIGMVEIADDETCTEAELAAADAVLVATDEQDRPVGYALVRLIDDHAHLEQLAVLPELGGRGLGTALLDAVATWAADRDHRIVTLTTFRDVAFNAPLYAKRGYAELPEPDWTPAIRALVAEEADHGLDPATRVVMQRRLG